MILIGEIALWAAVLTAVWGTATSIVAVATGRSAFASLGRWALVGTCVAVTVAVLVLAAALATSDFSLRYVAAYTTANLPVTYRLVALWAGHAGAMLVWSLAMSWVAVIAMVSARRLPESSVAWLTAIMGAGVACALLVTAAQANPFERLPWVPQEGRGLDPALQHVAMIVQPPLLAAGLAAAGAPFALGVAGIAGGAPSALWLDVVRRWATAAWTLLSMAMTAGMWWAYVDPVRTASWTMDSLTNAAILPWVALTGLTHVIAPDIRRDRMRTGFISLAAAASVLAMLAASIARSGLVDGVRSLPMHRDAPTWLGLSAAIIAIAAWLLLRRPDSVGATAFSPRRTWHRAAALVAHGAALMIALGVLGARAATSTEITLATGESWSGPGPLGQEWTLTSQGVSSHSHLNRNLRVLAIRAARGDRAPRLVRAENRRYFDALGREPQPGTTAPAVLTTLAGNVYIELVTVDRDGRAVLRVTSQPLVALVWMGALLLVLSGFVALWPARRAAAAGA